MLPILIVDDEPDIGALLKKLLKMKGYEADVFSDPFQALSKYDVEKYGLVVMDFKMAGMNGFELFERIKEIDSQAKVLFLSGDSRHYAEYIEKNPTTSRLRYLHKPVLMQDLAREVAKMLES